MGTTILRPLVIDDEVKAKIRDLREKAAAEPISLETMKQRAADYAEGKPLQEFSDYAIEIPEGFLVVYTVEHHEPGPVRHLSVSIETYDPEKGPNLEAVKMLMEEFGFILPLGQNLMYLEPAPDGGLAVNVVEPLDGNIEPFIKKE